MIAGIAGAQPNYWVDRGWTARAILIYLVDRPIDCEEFPFHAEPRSFPPRVIEDGAIIMLRFATDSSDGRVNYASFGQQHQQLVDRFKHQLRVGPAIDRRHRNREPGTGMDPA